MSSNLDLIYSVLVTMVQVLYLLEICYVAEFSSLVK